MEKRENILRHVGRYIGGMISTVSIEQFSGLSYVTFYGKLDSYLENTDKEYYSIKTSGSADNPGQANIYFRDTDVTAILDSIDDEPVFYIQYQTTPPAPTPPALQKDSDVDRLINMLMNGNPSFTLTSMETERPMFMWLVKHEMSMELFINRAPDAGLIVVVFDEDGRFRKLLA